MAIDSISKRASVLGVALGAVLLLPPDGAIGQGDRQTIAHAYSGVLADPPVIITPDCFTSLVGVIDTTTNAQGDIDPTGLALQSNIIEFTALEGPLCC